MSWFDIHLEELFASISADQVESPTIPEPPLPEMTRPRSDVRIVWLRRPQQSQQSGSYADHLFRQVEAYFEVFFAHSIHEMGLAVSEVGVIVNESLVETFRAAEAELGSRCRGLEEMNDPDQTSLQIDYLQQLRQSQNLVPNTNANAIAAWHGCNRDELERVCSYGLLNLQRPGDEGWYGNGVYFTQYPTYGKFYMEQKQKEEEGEHVLLLCWVLLGKPYAITEPCVGEPCQPGYDSHYVLLRSFLPVLDVQQAQGVGGGRTRE